MLFARNTLLAALFAITAEPVLGFADLFRSDKTFVSIYQSFRLVARSTSQHYQPGQAQCNDGGITCREACGGGSTKCDSTDSDELHCYDPSAGATCCLDGRGNSCAAGYYCYPGNLSQTLCCSKGTTESECLDKFVAAHPITHGTAAPMVSGSVTAHDGNTTSLSKNGNKPTIVASNSTAKANSTGSPTDISACGSLAVDMPILLGAMASLFAVMLSGRQPFAD